MTQRQPLSRMEVFTVTSSRASLESTETRPTIHITAPHSAGQADTHPSEQTHTHSYITAGTTGEPIWAFKSINTNSFFHLHK